MKWFYIPKLLQCREKTGLETFQLKYLKRICKLIDKQMNKLALELEP